MTDAEVLEASDDEMAEATLGVILAGGQGRHGRRRQGLCAACRTALVRPCSTAAPQKLVIVNANGDPARFADYDLPVVADTVDGSPDLAGVLAAMEWAASASARLPLSSPPPPRAVSAVIWGGFHGCWRLGG